MSEICQLFEDLRDTVDNDSYMWIVVWGPPRVSKTTLAGWGLYSLYKDWRKMFNAFGTSLPDIMHKIRNGLPELWPTVTKPTHMRVPGLNWDDFGAKSNKATTQYDTAFDEFKGGFDVLGRKLANLFATMVDPNEPTFQLLSKYTHEIQINARGKYKYDKVTWMQDFKGFKPRPKKTFIEYNTFDAWPQDVYEIYDSEIREDLTDEVLARIDDALADSHVSYTIRRLKQQDFDLLQRILEKGLLNRDTHEYSKYEKDSIIRLKSRNLITPVQVTEHRYSYDITNLGIEVLNELKKPKADSETTVKTVTPSIH